MIEPINEKKTILNILERSDNIIGTINISCGIGKKIASIYPIKKTKGMAYLVLENALIRVSIKFLKKLNNFLIADTNLLLILYV